MQQSELALIITPKLPPPVRGRSMLPQKSYEDTAK